MEFIFCFLPIWFTLYESENNVSRKFKAVLPSSVSGFKSKQWAVCIWFGRCEHNVSTWNPKNIAFFKIFTATFPYGEIFVWLSFLRQNFLTAKLSSGKISLRPNILAAKFPGTKIPTANWFGGKLFWGTFCIGRRFVPGGFCSRWLFDRWLIARELLSGGLCIGILTGYPRQGIRSGKYFLITKYIVV